MFGIKYYFLLYLFVGVIAVSCTSKNEKDKFEREFSFDRNLVNTEAAEVVCELSEDSVLLKEIFDFTILNDTSFVAMDGRGAYLYHISGAFKKQFGNFGQAGGEMISPSLVYATSNYVYIWCTSLMKFLIFDHEANLKNELSGFKRAVKKFAVNPSDEIMYLYTSGFLDDLENKMYDVIDIYDIAKKTSKKFGERSAEDEILSSYRNTGGLHVDSDRFIYLHPANLIIHDFDLNSDKAVRYKINDKAFHTTKITSSVRDIMGDNNLCTDYFCQNSLVKGLYKDNDQYIISSEIGKFYTSEQSRLRDNKKNERKVKLYIFDSSFNPDRTILFDYIASSNIVVYSDYLYFITLMDSDEQIFSLKRFSLLR